MPLKTWLVAALGLGSLLLLIALSMLASSRKAQALVQQPTGALHVVARGRALRQPLDCENLTCDSTGLLQEVHSDLEALSCRSDAAGEELRLTR